MLCNKCQKNNATIQVTKIINGEKQEIRLCEECARNSQELVLGMGHVHHQFGFFDLLSGLLNNDIAQQQAAFRYHQPSRCERCNYTYDQFQQTGKLSCENCYQSFSHQLEGLLRRIHGANRHTGKIPLRTGGTLKLKNDLNQLKEKLKNAIAKEEFEEAAVLRDQIRNLEKKLVQEG